MERLRRLEEENVKLKKLVADLSLDKVMLQDVTDKKLLRSAEKWEAARYLQEHFHASERKSSTAYAVADQPGMAPEAANP